MKKYIILAALSLIAALQLSAQVVVKADGDSVRFDSKNPIVKIVPENAGSNNVVFTLEDGTTQSFDFSDLSKVVFAQDEATAIEDIKAGKTVIVYNESANKVSVANPAKKSVITLFNAEGKCLRSVKSNEMSLLGLPAGLYIVNYNGVLNAKILK